LFIEEVLTDFAVLALYAQFGVVERVGVVAEIKVIHLSAEFRCLCFPFEVVFVVLKGVRLVE
jgi:hypothetical protein